jgi:hypothetical protein
MEAPNVLTLEPDSHFSLSNFSKPEFSDSLPGKVKPTRDGDGKPAGLNAIEKAGLPIR